MADEKPEIGLVIRHVYLWRNEALKGRDEGQKARPCVIVHKRVNEFDETMVFISPITHTIPENPKYAIEIPLATKKRLGLDGEKSWIITNEVNCFTWKGVDLRITRAGRISYGDLPHGLTSVVVKQVQAIGRKKKLNLTQRDDQTLLEKLRKIRQQKPPKISKDIPIE